MEPLVSIRLCDPHRHYQPGDRIRCSYHVDAIPADAIQSVEASILWITSGKGEEDMGIHEFHRRLRSDGNPDLRTLYEFETSLPNSPLSFGGTIVKLHWLVRVRLFLQEGLSYTQDLSFQLGSHPVFTEEAP
jgi:hypothetical protein